LLREKVSVVGCGRTDAGVHASQFFLHFNWLGELEKEKLKFRLNSILPGDIAIFKLQKVREDAHARFDAYSRSYQYRILEGKNPFMIGTVRQVRKLDLDLEKMNEAAGMLTQYSDFQCFSRSKSDVKSFVCHIEEAFWRYSGELLVFEITSNRFLRNMVRAIVGTLIEIGQGKREVEDFRRIIESGDRTQAGPSARAEGLYLTRVKYPENIFID
jgi:tRNA pseudouridine38-40 synthase